MWADAAPERSRNPRRLLADIVDLNVVKRVRRLGRAVHRIRIEAPHRGDEVVEAGCTHHPGCVKFELAREVTHILS